jgi:anthranilate phosphoribosyltransferase
MDKSDFLAFVDGKLTDDEGLAFLAGFRDQPITGERLAFAAQAMRERMIPLEAPAPLLDTCGTGGDQQATLNLSTGSAFVLAAAGVRVAKHGNRAVSSTSGSSDVLHTLGIAVDQPGDVVLRCIEKVGLGFCFAPRFHPRLKAIAPLRKKLGIPTIFNYLGPLCNPARVQYQVLGVGQASMVRPMAEALCTLGVERAVVVHGEPGLDEVSLQGATQALVVERASIAEIIWSPSDLGLPPSSVEQIRCKDARDSATQLLDIFQGVATPGRDWVLANAGIGLWVAGRAKSPADGVQQAAEVVRSGHAMDLLQKLQSLCPLPS